MIVTAIELEAKKLTLRDRGTLDVDIIQGGERLASGSLNVRDLRQTLGPIEIDVNDMNITGRFDIVLNYNDSGYITMGLINVIEGTEVADNPSEGGDDKSHPDTTKPPQDSNDSRSNKEPENVIFRKGFSTDSDHSLTIDTLEFSAKKLTSRDGGTLTVSTIQGGQILGQDAINIREMKQTYQNIEASFDNIRISAGDFEVVFIYDGKGKIFIASIEIQGVTETQGINSHQRHQTSQVTQSTSQSKQ